MKLYAKTKNSKGKIEGMGDNEVIVIELTHGNKVVGEIFFDETGFIVRAEGKEVLDYEVKGKSKECTHDSTHMTHDGSFCADCGVSLKGKSQKGEKLSDTFLNIKGGAED